jgi:molybdopterin converting factor small subunit
MKVTVKLIGPFVHKMGFSERELEVPAATTVEDLIPLIEGDRTRPKIVTRNGRAVAPGEEIRDGDRIVVSPIYSGG